MKQAKRTMAVLVMVLLASVGCIHKTGGSVTPRERVMVYNATLAEVNNTLEQGVEAVNNSKLISDAQARPIIVWTGNVATVHMQITAVLGRGTATTADVESVRALIQQIKVSGAEIVSSGAAGIKNPKSQQTIGQDIQFIANTADELLVAFQQLVPAGGK